MKIYDSPNSSLSVTSPNSASDDFYQVNMEFERKGLLIESMKTHKREVKLFFRILNQLELNVWDSQNFRCQRLELRDVKVRTLCDLIGSFSYFHIGQFASFDKTSLSLPIFFPECRSHVCNFNHGAFSYIQVICSNNLFSTQIVFQSLFLFCFQNKSQVIIAVFFDCFYFLLHLLV